MMNDDILKIRSKMRSREKLLAGWLTFPDSTIAEIMCQAGFDFLIIDAEHGPIDFRPMEQLIQVANLMGTPIVVRIPWNDPVFIKKVLDLGSNGILVPLCTTAAEVEESGRSHTISASGNPWFRAASTQSIRASFW